eukprot:2406537-Amphidinium_carterae.1
MECRRNQDDLADEVVKDYILNGSGAAEENPVDTIGAEARPKPEAADSALAAGLSPGTTEAAGADAAAEIKLEDSPIRSSEIRVEDVDYGP